MKGIFISNTICSTRPGAYEEEHDQSDRFAAAAGSARALVHALRKPRGHSLHRRPRGWDHSATEGEEPTGKYAAAQLLSRAAAELSEYFERKRTSFTLPLDPEGTDFQLIVWEHLKTIPAGYTTTYGEISRAVGPGAPAQAVGQAVGRNKVSIMIPCHRVIGADGSLTGYAGGVERKQFLLDLEEPEEVREARLF